MKDLKRTREKKKKKGRSFFGCITSSGHRRKEGCFLRFIGSICAKPVTQKKYRWRRLYCMNLTFTRGQQRCFGFVLENSPPALVKLKILFIWNNNVKYIDFFYETENKQKKKTLLNLLQVCLLGRLDSLVKLRGKRAVVSRQRWQMQRYNLAHTQFNPPPPCLCCHTFLSGPVLQLS